MPEADVIKTLRPAPAPDGLSQDQRDIWEKFEEAKLKAIRKNHDYGSSVFIPPCLRPDLGSSAGIEVRMSDKLQRLRSLLGGKEGCVSDETVRDTMEDLGVYCFLWLITHARKQTETAIPVKE